MSGHFLRMAPEQLAAEQIQHLKGFLRHLKPRYEQYAEALHSKFSREEDIAKASKDDLIQLNIPRGAAGVILKAAKNSGANFTRLLHGACTPQSWVQARVCWRQLCCSFG